MPVNITTLTQLITTFKQETREESVTVDVLGSLLQKIVDLLGTTALQSDVSGIANWRALFVKLNTLVTNIAIGSDDRNNVYLSVTKGNVATGSSQPQPNSLCIRQATTERAGAMRAQQVQDLNKCKSDITSVNTQLNSLYDQLGKYNTELMNFTRQLRADETSISDLQTSCQSLGTSILHLQTSIRTLQANFNTFASMKSTTTIHIECQPKGKQLYIQGASQLIRSGLKPVIFRYTIRTSRHGRDKDGNREYMPKRRGWHRFFDDWKIKIGNDGIVYFSETAPRKTTDTKLKYATTPEFLFTYVRVNTKPDSQEVDGVYIPYGQRIFNIIDSPRTFKFAIGFYKPVSDNKAFNFSDLRTNLAVFRVRVEAIITEDQKVTMKYLFSR